jgi:aspartate/methionine/tyrosine aminotransferase
MPFPRFAYLEWVRAYQRAARYPLTFSGVDVVPFPPASDAPPAAFAGHAATRFGVPEEAVIPCGGTTGGVFAVLAALLSAGDAVVVEGPTYELLRAVPEALGARVMQLPRRSENDYAITDADLAWALTARPKAIVVSNPHNPSGRLLSQQELRGLAQQAQQAGAVLVVDEVYLPFAPKEPSAFHLGAITIGSVTKITGLGDMRLGWVFTPPQHREKILGAIDIAGGYPSATALQQGITALSRWDSLCAPGLSAAQSGWEKVAAFLSAQEKLVCTPPGAGIICFPRVKGARDAGAFVEKARTELELGLVPGRFFGDPAGFRLGFGGPAEILDEGLRRLGEAIQRFL